MGRIRKQEKVFLKVLEFVGDKEVAQNIVDIYTSASINVLLEERQLDIPFIGTIKLEFTKRADVLSASKIIFVKFESFKNTLSDFFMRLGFKGNAQFNRYLTEHTLDNIANIYTKYLKTLSEHDKNKLVYYDALLDHLRVLSGQDKLVLSRITKEAIINTYRRAMEDNRIDIFLSVLHLVNYSSKRKPFAFYEDTKNLNEKTLTAYLDKEFI